jgi:predicted membrane-bound mannosyltransferase
MDVVTFLLVAVWILLFFIIYYFFYPSALIYKIFLIFTWLPTVLWDNGLKTFGVIIDLFVKPSSDNLDLSSSTLIFFYF